MTNEPDIIRDINYVFIWHIIDREQFSFRFFILIFSWLPVIAPRNYSLAVVLNRLLLMAHGIDPLVLAVVVRVSLEQVYRFLQD
jgi:hypothetical protein